MHRDPDGDTKLKSWGGRKAYPFFLSQLTAYSPAFRKGEKVGRVIGTLLCQELYSHDPFEVTGPVSDDQNFFGRRRKRSTWPENSKWVRYERA